MVLVKLEFQRFILTDAHFSQAVALHWHEELTGFAGLTCLSLRGYTVTTLRSIIESIFLSQVCVLKKYLGLGESQLSYSRVFERYRPIAVSVDRES